MTSTRFDYVIVGGGSAGCVLAARLSEDAAVRVLLLEHGPEYTMPELAIPPAWPALWGTPVDHSYDTVPQPHAGGGAHNWPRGRVLGGSSSINAMVYLRGHPADFEHWAKAGGGDWDYDSVLPYFKRMETVTGGDPDFRGDSGPIHPAPAAGVANPLSPVFVDAAHAAGFPVTDDFNGRNPEGVGWHDLSISGGQRQSTAQAYLAPIRASRPNLTISTSSHSQTSRYFW